ncbi:MAG TPA: flagellar basal-body MS-ring/collar protein FliF [Acetobacteraceae bacterium]|nr:flagellar basal-body MS-ring/collar protein FliF [Acetobacteraceae bacterium]
MKSLLDGLKALGPARLGALAAVGLGTLALLALLVLSSGAQPMALLYGDLALRDSGQMTEALGRAHVPYRLAAGGSEIMVPEDQVPAARVLLARQGLPSGGTVGYGIFDHADMLGMTPFQERIDETRAMEGELARTIEAIQGVRAARVHLVLAHRAPFARESRAAQASVLLTMQGAASLDRDGVQAILNLIAAAVPGLKPQNIAIVDSRGDLLARAGAPVGAAGMVLSDEGIRRATELRLARAVERMLARSLGPDHVRAEAAVQMDFDQVHETAETYDPNGQVALSEQSITKHRQSTRAAPSVSVQNNLPNAPGAQSGPGSTESSRQDTTNYQISKTVRTLIHQQPKITRISLAVMVDAARAHTPAELARITDLVKTAIGFDAKRGDTVQVVAMPFAGSDLPPMKATAHGWFGVSLGKGDILRLAESGIVGLIGLLALLLVLRPMVLRLTAPPPTGAGLPALAGGGAIALGGVPALPAAGPALAPAGAELALLEDESMVNVAQIEGQIRASSIRRISEMAEKHPSETLSIVRGWMAQESG